MCLILSDSDEFGISLFVFARDPTTFFTEFNTEVQQELVHLGFTHDYNKPVVRSH